MGYIYGLICPKINEIRYVGQTINELEYRLNAHKYDKRGNTHKINWITKLEKEGLLNQVRIIALESCENEMLNEKEQYWIKFYENNNLTNSTTGGDSNFKVSDTTREKISKALTGKKMGKDNPNYQGKSVTEETRRKHSENMKGRFVGELNPLWGKRGKLSPNFGKKLTEEQKKKISQAKIGTVLSEEHKKNISKGLNNAYANGYKKPKVTEEQKAKISESVLKYYKKHGKTKKEKPVKIKKEKITKAKEPRKKYFGEENHFYGKKHTEDTRLKISEALKNKPKKPVMMFDKEGVLLRTFIDREEIKDFLNVADTCNLFRVIGKDIKYKGCYWKYGEIKKES